LYFTVYPTCREEFILLFLKDKPSIYAFENELKKYNLIEAELAAEVDDFRYVKVIKLTILELKVSLTDNLPV
jgi:hypothetical protein